MEDLVGLMTDSDPDLWFLITTDGTAPIHMPDNCFHTILPEDTPRSAQKFLAHWKPGVLAWISDVFQPALIAKTATRNIPLFLLDSGNAMALSKQLQRYPGLTASTLRHFTRILTGDATTSQALQNAGAAASLIETIGVMDRQANPPRCVEAEREALARLLGLRPVWLAAGLHSSEYETVIAAHSQAMRRSHRLLLILSPSDMDQGDEIATYLMGADQSFAQRSKDQEPDDEIHIYIADTPEELGLWYRLAPITFIGHTLTISPPGGATPFDAANLGSSILFGPNATVHHDALQRLHRAGAALLVNDTDALAGAVETLLSPDIAADMAHAAWRVCSAGAEVTARVTNLLTTAIARYEAQK